MKFHEALVDLKKGSPIRRAHWTESRGLRCKHPISDPEFYEVILYYAHLLYAADICADDWTAQMPENFLFPFQGTNYEEKN